MNKRNTVVKIFFKRYFFIFQHELHLCLDVDCDEKVSAQVPRASKCYGGMHRIRFYAELLLRIC